MNSKNSRVAHKPDEVDRNDETARTAAIKASPAYRGV